MSRKPSKRYCKYRITSKIFHLPKDGESEDSYEDSYYPLAVSANYNIGGKRNCIRIAVGDGVSESYRSASWSSSLTKLFCRKGVNFLQSNDFLKVIDDWKTSEIIRAEKLYADDRNLFEIIKELIYGFTDSERDREYTQTWGSSTTFCGLEIALQRKNLNARCLSIGDTCFFIFRDGRLLQMQPNFSADDFNYLPEQITTQDTLDTVRETFLQSYSIKRNDILVLGTDTISKWLVNTSEKTPYEKISEILSLSSHEKFEEYILDKRRADVDTLENDDVTVVILQIH